MFEVEYLWNGLAKKDRVNANLVLRDWPNFGYPRDFVVDPRLITLGNERFFFMLLSLTAFQLF